MICARLVAIGIDRGLASILAILSSGLRLENSPSRFAQMVGRGLVLIAQPTGYNLAPMPFGR